MGFAQSDRGVDVKRIEHQRLAAPAGGDLFGCGVRERIRTPDNEGLKAQPRVEWRTAKCLVHIHEWNAGAHAGDLERAVAAIARRQRRLQRFRLRRWQANRRGTDGQFQAHDVRLFGLPLEQHLFAVMRLDPVAEKTGRHREPHRSLLHGFELHAPEPAAEDILAKFRAQLILDPSPSLLIGACRVGACHVGAFGFEEEPKRARQADALDFAKTLYNSVQESGRAARPKRADVRAAANFSRLTGRQAGKPQASELQAETREARLAIDRLHLRLQLSCPPPPPLADSHHPVKRCGACRSVSQRDPLYLCFQPPNKLRLHYPLYNTLRVNSINWTHLSRAHSSTGFRLPRF